MNGLDLLKDMTLLDEAVIEKNTQPPRRKLPARWLLPIAACLAVLLCFGALFPVPWSEKVPVVNTLTEPERFLGPVRIGQFGSLDDLMGAASVPPEFTFHCSRHVVTARVLENCPDIYYIPDVRLDHNPTPYRLLRLEVLDAVAGTGLPEQLWYLIPERFFVDMTGYDTLLISLGQVGFGSVTLENVTAGKFETFDLVFSSGTHPELGDIIAFTDGVFDERLWQEENWHYGYQFGRAYLNDPERDYGNMVVFRGYTLDETVAQIRKKIREDYPQYSEPAVERLEFQTEAAQLALAFVQDPENGIYVQVQNGIDVTFCRYAGGIRTNESVTIDPETEAVTWSPAAFTQEELTAMPDVPGCLQQLQAAENTPEPPHMDPAGKELFSYGAYGQYIKAESGVYGIVTETWVYWEQQDKNWRVGYYDVRYTLLDTQTGEPQEVSADELNFLLGEKRFYDDGCGTAFPIPMC